MAIWKFKSCPRCRGDIYIEKDFNSWREQCLQCGYVRYLPITVKAGRHSEQQNERNHPVSVNRAVAIAKN